MKGTILSIAVSKSKGTRKSQIQEARLIEEHGIEGDAHAGSWHRQVSFLAFESIERARAVGLEVGFGDFAENIATQGIEWHRLPVGSIIRTGNVVMELTQIGKECHRKCAIYYMAGDCIMPKEGVFAKVISGGVIRIGDEIEVFPGERE